LPEILLVYPFFRRRLDRSPFRFPPLGIGYIASSLKQRKFTVGILDGTFRNRKEIIREIKDSKPEIVGIYSMYSMEKDSVDLARNVRGTVNLLIAGGPLPTVNPSIFLNDFDIVVLGEAENTMLDIAEKFANRGDYRNVERIAYKDKDSSEVHYTPRRSYIEDLNSIPFPARELFDNDAYKRYYRKHFGYTITSIISSRGCPFNCDFCSKPIFGDRFKSRSPKNIVDEMESIFDLGYDSIWFADDCFTISRDRVMEICDEVMRRGLEVKWQCLSRADALDQETAQKMNEAGCERIYFGLESGDNRILRTIMRKGIDVEAARKTVHNAKSAGIETGAFFILGYPGENDETILNTIRYATSLPLNYLSFTLPYPIPGTGLHEKVKHVLREQYKRRITLIDHSLLFRSEFSEFKLKFGIVKAMTQFQIRRSLGERGYKIFGKPFEKATDTIFRKMR